MHPHPEFWLTFSSASAQCVTMCWFFSVCSTRGLGVSGRREDAGTAVVPAPRGIMSPESPPARQKQASE